MKLQHSYSTEPLLSWVGNKLQNDIYAESQAGGDAIMRFLTDHLGVIDKAYIYNTIGDTYKSLPLLYSTRKVKQSHILLI